MIIRDESVYEALCQKCGVKSRAFPRKKQAIKWWNTRAAGWIKTSERLPEENQCVLVVPKFGFWKPQIFIGCISNLKLWSIYGSPRKCFVENEIPYWMPLPELPEVGE